MKKIDPRLKRTITVSRIAIPLTIAAVILAAQYMYEKTYLTYHDGPQMIGFTFAHSPHGVLIIFLFYGAMIWGVITFLSTFLFGFIYITRRNIIMMAIVILCVIVSSEYLTAIKIVSKITGIFSLN
ncbi:MAG TPA: hypothetical protein ENJ60_13565 [Aeromonadales bacterium]|nr:hypothetical protein [Aeromonadales bacterium]